MRSGPLLALLVAVLGCGLASEQEYEVTGRVESTNPAARQVTIAHDAIPGFMPAMTMNFDVADAALLEGVEPGEQVHFHLQRTGTLLLITALEVTAAAEAGFAGAAVESPPLMEVAPDFELIDHESNPFRLSSLRGRAVLLDFIFTSCPGPCPMLSAAHVRLWKRVPEELKARTHLVSVSIDPATDSPAKLRAYGKARGVDFAHWTFCTGAPEAVQAVLDAYGIGKTRTDSGELIHTLVTFLIGPDGKLVRSYLGLNTPDDEIIADLRRVLDARAGAEGEGMEKIVTLIRRTPGLEPDAFRKGLLAALGPTRGALSFADVPPEEAGLDPASTPAPAYDAVLETPDAPPALPAALVAESFAYRVRALVQKAHARDWPAGQRSPGIKGFYPVMRGPGMTHDEFVKHWREVHGPLAVARHVGMSQYVQNVVQEVLTPGAPAFDGFSALHFPTARDIRERFVDSPEGGRLIAEDVAKFVGESIRLDTSEYVLAD